MLNPSATILVFDLGTTNFKGTLFDINGELKALARIPTPFTNTRGVHSEISVPAFDAAIGQLAEELRASAPDDYAAIAAVTFSSQTNSFVLLGPSGEAMTPFIIWNDRRAAAINPPLDAFMALPDFYARSGVPGLSPEFMLAKLYWHQEETAEMWERVDRILLISDYLTWRFTGKYVTEAGAAGLTGLVDIHTLEWRDDALALLALERDSFCDIVRAGTNLGPDNRSASGSLSTFRTTASSSWAASINTRVPSARATRNRAMFPKPPARSWPRCAARMNSRPWRAAPCSGALPPHPDATTR
jgi:sugar (pentulose or hexulose) kinase